MLDNDLKEELDSNFETLGKLFLQADYTIWLDGGINGTLITNRESIDPSSDYDTGLGNAVDGANALLMALTSITRDENVREDLYDIIRECGNIFSIKLNTPGGEKAPKDIFKTLIETAEDFFTVGGSKHGEQSVGIPLYNGNPNDANVFSNSELTRLLLTMQIGNLGLFARSDRPESLISSVDPFESTSSPEYESSGHKNYLLDKFIKNLAYIGFDPESANIEESIYDLIRFDTYGRDRKTSNAYPTSYLEQFLFLSAASQAGGWNDGGQNGEITDDGDPNREHGHGISVEHVTFNDSLFAMGGSETCGNNTYGLAFDNLRSRISRSAKTRFTYGQRSNFQFGYTQNWPAQKFMSGYSQGDVGIPTGGNPNGGAYNSNDDIYEPFTPDGFGDTNMSRYTLYWMVRACWNGEGPYYYDPAKAGNQVETVTFNTASLDRVEVFQHAIYEGYSAKLKTGNYDLAALRSLGIGNDDLSSIKVPTGLKVTAYQNDNYGGSSWVFTSDESNLSNRGCNDAISSLKVERTSSAKDRTFNVYYRPNGKVYMLKSIDEPYLYLYPADGDDKEVNWNVDNAADLSTYYLGKGISGRTYERWNRYRAKWYSDFYMIQVVDDLFNKWYITPEKIAVGSSERDSLEAGRFVFNELISEDDPNRACASHEEAIFRNYQWVMTEKKFAIVVPLALTGLSLAHAGVFQVVEGNGIAGLTSARKYASNADYWAIAGNTDNTSPWPGDYRICMKNFKGDTIISYETVWGSMANGTVNPPLVAHNAPGVFRFGFPRYYQAGENNDKNHYALGSRRISDPNSNYGFSVGDDRWNKRNTLLPLIITMLGTVLDHQNKNFADKANRDTTLSRLKKFTETMMIPILPRFYYRYSKGGTETTVNTWVPRINGGTVTNPNYGYTNPDNMPHHRRIHIRSHEVDSDRSYWGGWKQRNFYQPMAMRTPLNLLIDSDVTSPDGHCDGVLALLTEYDVSRPRGTDNNPKTRLITKALKLLMKLSDEKFNDPPGLDYSSANFDSSYPTWGARRKLFYALEQIVSSMKFTKTKVVDILGRPPKNITHSSWMFATGVDTDGDGHFDSFSGIRPEDIIIDKSLHSLIGHNKTSTVQGTGLAAYPDERDISDPNFEGKSWNLFNDTISRLGELLSNNGTTKGNYNVMEDVINIVDKCLAKVNPTEEQIKALVHTIGISATYYDGNWIYPDDVKTIITEYLPLMLEISANNPDFTQGENMRMAALLSSDFMRPGGFADYIVHTAETDYSAREIIEDLYRFLSDPLISDIHSQLWDDLIEMNEGMLESMSRSMDNAGWEIYDKLGFQYNGPNGEVYFDIFGNLGKVFSR